MNEPITQELRETIEMMDDDEVLPFTKPCLRSVADRIDRLYERRIEATRKVTAREFARLLRGVADDYESGFADRIEKPDMEVVRCRDCRFVKRWAQDDIFDMYVCERTPLDKYVGGGYHCPHGERAIDE